MVRRTVGFFLVAAALAACGEDGVEVASTPPTAPPHAQRERVTPPIPDPTDVELQSLVASLIAEWQREERNDDAIARAEDALVAAGPAVIPYLIAMLDDADLAEFAHELLPRFGNAAVGPLLTRLESAGTGVANEVLYALDELGTIWSRGPDAERACALLMGRIKAHDDTTDDDLSDEEREKIRENCQAALGLLYAGGPPCGRFVAADLADLFDRWARDEATDDLADLSLDALREMGAEAAPGAGRLLATVTDFDDPDIFDILREIGAAAPDTLPDLIVLLASDEVDLRLGAARVLRTWGSQADPAAPALTALLDDPEPDVRAAAAFALAGVPSGAEAAWRALLAITAHDHPGDEPDAIPILRALMSDARVVRGIVDAVSRLSTEQVDQLLWVHHVPVTLSVELLQALAQHASPEIRTRVLWWWKSAERGAPIPDVVLALLDDSDDLVRVSAADAILYLGGERSDEATAIVHSLVTSPRADVRDTAIEAFGSLAERDPAFRPRLVAALRDPAPSVRLTAVSWLADDGLPLDGIPADVVAWLARQLVDGPSYMDDSLISVLARCDGGVQAFENTLRPILLHEFDPDDADSRMVYILRAAGPYAAGLQDALAGVPLDESDYWSREITEILAELNADADPNAPEARLSLDATTIRSLLATGSAGRATLVLFAGRNHDGAVLDLLPTAHDSGLADAIVSAATKTGVGEAAKLNRLGAARLAPCLGARRAGALLAKLFEDEDPDVRDAALESLLRVAREAPDSVPTRVLAPALAAETTRTQAAASALVALLGTHAKAAEPGIRALLSNDSDATRLAAADALWRVTGDVGEATAIVRSWMAVERPVERADKWHDYFGFIPWRQVTDILSAAEPDPEDVVRLLRVVPPGPPTLLLPLLARYGPAAAPAVPTLREYLRTTGISRIEPDDDELATICFVIRTPLDDYGDERDDGAAAARALGHIGRAARPALPDLRRWVALTGDPGGAAREAIRRIEAARD